MNRALAASIRDYRGGARRMLSSATAGIGSDSEPPAAAPVYFKVDTATAGTLHGKMRLHGPQTRARKDRHGTRIRTAPACIRTSAFSEESLVVNADGSLSNVFVYIKSGLEGKKFEPPSEPVTIDQKGCWFHPRVLGIETGQPLQVTNSDPVTHNIHPLAEINREWNHSQGGGIHRWPGDLSGPR